MAPARPRLAPPLLLLLFMLPAAAAGAAALDTAGPDGEAPIPDSATGAGAESQPWPNAVLPPAPRVAPTPSPAPARP